MVWRIFCRDGSLGSSLLDNLKMLVVLAGGPVATPLEACHWSSAVVSVSLHAVSTFAPQIVRMAASIHCINLVFIPYFITSFFPPLM